MNVTSLFRQAVELHQGGRLDEAGRLYGDILAREPGNATAHQLMALLRFQQGKNPDALTAIEAALAITPDGAEALAIRGNVLMALGRADDALESFDRAIARKPDYAEALYNRGNCLQSLHRDDEAVADYGNALALDPGNEPALTNRGNVLRRLKRYSEALADYVRAEKLRPGDPLTQFHRAGVLKDMQRPTEALSFYEAALAMAPGLAEAWNDRGIVLAALNRRDEALASYDRALALDPGMARAWNNRANSLRALQRFDEALASAERALAINPDFAQAWSNRGAILRDLHRPDDAMASLDRAISLAPDDAAALFNRATLQWTEFSRYRPALDDLEKAVALDPDLDYALGNLLHLKMYGGDWRDFAALKARIDQGVRAGKRIIEPFAYQAISESPADLLACAIIHAAQYPPVPSLWTGQARAHRKIRVGYLSGEFRAQATQYLAAGLYERHDRDEFEVVAFDNGKDDASPMRRRLEAAFGRIFDISSLNDRQAGELILKQEIDILVNLNGYFGQERMGVFAQRPAPIQVNYLGFPGTLGAAYIDYILADRIVIPEAERKFYTEQVVWLPDCYQVNDDRRAIAEGRAVRGEHGLPAQDFVFCNFNQSYKLTPDMFALWMRILKAVDGSVLWLMESNSAWPPHLRAEAERHGVAGDRLVFAPNLPLDRHLARLALADLFLDALPYNAHTTASDALWAGLPLLTCRGHTFAGRVAASLLTAIGLPELIAESPAAYESLAVRLAREPSLLSSLKARLAQNRPTHPLFDTDRFRRHIEAAYRQMWEIAQRGEAPKSFAVPTGA